MGLDWKKWTKNDMIFGIILPVIAVFVIVLISKLPVANWWRFLESFLDLRWKYWNLSS